MKTCKSCGVEKPLNDFYKNATFLDGCDSACKECKRAYQNEWRRKNRDAHRAYSRQYQHDHADERAAYYAEWLADNAEQKAEYDRQWKREHPERMRQRHKLENARRRARLKHAEGTFTVAEWIALKEYYDNTCLACGGREPDVKITPDHIMPLALGGSNSIENIQPLCWSCNAAKQATFADYRGGACED